MGSVEEQKILNNLCWFYFSTEVLMEIFFIKKLEEKWDNISLYLGEMLLGYTLILWTYNIFAAKETGKILTSWKSLRINLNNSLIFCSTWMIISSFTRDERKNNYHWKFKNIYRLVKSIAPMNNNEFIRKSEKIWNSSENC